RRNRANEELVVLHVQVLKLNSFLVRHGQHSLILLLEFVEALLRALGLFCFARATSKHFVKESHDRFLSFTNDKQGESRINGGYLVRDGGGRMILLLVTI